MRIWLHITAGRGPIECAWVVPRVLKRLLQDAAKCGLRYEVVETRAGAPPSTLVSAIVAVDAHSHFAASWTGTIQWIGNSPFRPHEKRRNWFVAVEQLAMPVAAVWSERDVKFQTLRSSGPGGQHVNKTESAVRATHVPSGLAVTAREQRSQSANRKLAVARLAELFAGRTRSEQRNAQDRRWMLHNELQRGNPVRIYEGEYFELRTP